MKYLALSLLLAVVLVLGLNGAPQAGFGQYGSQLDSGILNFGAIDSGVFDIQVGGNDELVWTVPVGRDFILRSAWLAHYNFAGDTHIKVERATGGRFTMVTWPGDGNQINYRHEDWSSFGFRLRQGDQLWINGRANDPLFCWSGFYINP